jgi:hypothetical protein
LQAYFERAGEALAKMSGARRALAPRQVAGTLNGLVRDLLHVESLLIGLDGFENVDRLVTNLGVVLRDNEAAVVGMDQEVSCVPSTPQLVHGDIVLVGRTFATAAYSIGSAIWTVSLYCCRAR